MSLRALGWWFTAATVAMVGMSAWAWRLAFVCEPRETMGYGFVATSCSVAAWVLFLCAWPFWVDRPKP